MPVNTATAVPAVTLADAKAHLRVEHADEDELINNLILAATQAAEHELQRVLITRGDQTGYGASPADVPVGIRQWLLLNVGYWYANRESASMQQLEPLPFVGRLLDPFRTWA